MKAILRSLLLLVLFVLPTHLFAQTLIAGWDFQSGTGTSSAAGPGAPLVYVANVGTGTLYLDGTNGSSTWTSTGTASTAGTSAFTGTGVNATNGLASGTTATSALAVQNSTFNGFGMVFKVTTTGIPSLSVSYATQGTATGFNTQVWQYSTDLTNWTTFASISPRAILATTFANAGIITLPPIVDLNATTTYIKLIVNGSTSTSGNNRLDNIQILTGPTVYYWNGSGDISSAASYGPNTNGSGTPPSDLNGNSINAVYELANHPGTATLTSNLTIGTSLIIPSGTTLDLAGNTLTVNSITGAGTLTGSYTSSLVANASGIASFASGKEQLKNLTVAATGNNTLGLTTALNIASTGTVTVSGGALGANGFLTLKSDASGTANVGTVANAANGAGIGGNVIAERYLADKRAWRLIGTPVLTTQTINAAWQEGGAGVGSDLSPNFGTYMVGAGAGFDISSTSASLLIYTTGALANAGNTTTLTPSSNAGYFLFSVGSRSINPSDGTSHSSTVLRTTGTVKQGTQTAVAIATGATTFTLVGNPYPAAVDFTAVTKSSTVPNTFYAWDIGLGTYGGYVTVTNGVATPASPSGYTNIIPSGAAVFVKTDNTGAGTVTFTEASKAAAGNGTFGNFPVAVLQHNLRVNLTDANAHLIDGVLTNYIAGGSNNIDGADASKMTNFYENMSLARAGSLLAVESRSELVARDTVFIQLSGVKTTAYNLQVDPTGLNQPGTEAYLNDAYLKTSTKLDMATLSNTAFTTTTDTLSYKNRFSVVLVPLVTTTATIPARTGASVIAYPNPVTGKLLNLSFSGMPIGNYNVTLSNTLGQVMQKNSLFYNGSSSSQSLNVNYGTGMYVVNIQSGGYSQNIKVVIP